jgi:hypothetical protein
MYCFTSRTAVSVAVAIVLLLALADPKTRPDHRAGRHVPAASSTSFLVVAVSARTTVRTERSPCDVLGIHPPRGLASHRSGQRNREARRYAPRVSAVKTPVPYNRTERVTCPVIEMLF